MLVKEKKMKPSNDLKDEQELDSYPVISTKNLPTINHTNHNDNEQVFTNNSILRVFRREYVNYMLLNRFPIKLLVSSIIFFTLTNLALIAVQLIAVLAVVPFYYLAAGCWYEFF